MGVVSGNILVRLSMFAGRKLPSGPGGEGLSSRRPAPYPGCVESPEGTLPGPARPGSQGHTTRRGGDSTCRTRSRSFFLSGLGGRVPVSPVGSILLKRNGFRTSKLNTF